MIIHIDILFSTRWTSGQHREKGFAQIFTLQVVPWLFLFQFRDFNSFAYTFLLIFDGSKLVVWILKLKNGSELTF